MFVVVGEGQSKIREGLLHFKEEITRFARVGKGCNACHTVSGRVFYIRLKAARFTIVREEQ